MAQFKWTVMILKAATIVIAGQELDVTKFSSEHSVTSEETKTLLAVTTYFLVFLLLT